MSSSRRPTTAGMALLVVLAAVLALLGPRTVRELPPSRPAWAQGPLASGMPFTVRTEADGLRFAASVTPADRAWILAALARARPEARMLIERVDGLVEVQIHTGDPPGVARFREGGVVVSLDRAIADHEYGSGVAEHVVLHELGHVVEQVLVAPELAARLDAEIPRRQGCDAQGVTGACAPAEERFADTFARWALGDLRLNVPVGYQIDLPPSLEAWGMPLGELAYRTEDD